MENRTFAESAPRSPCPRCAAPLLAATVPPHGLLGCVSCGGVFLSHGAVRAVLSQSKGHDALESFAARTVGVAGVHPERGGPAACPVCTEPMAAVEIPGLSALAHTCNAHGSWFDAGDLARLHRTVEDARVASWTPASSTSEPLLATALYFPRSTARLTSRLGASILDGLFLLPAFGVTMVLLGTGAPLVAIIALGFGSILASVGLQSYWAATRGQTYGKKQMGIRVVRADGSPAGGFRILILRNFIPYFLIPGLLGAAAQLIDSAGDVPGAYLAEMALWPVSLLFSQGGLLLVFLPARRAIHDYVAGTIVVGS